MEARAGVGPTYSNLQSGAKPLCYRARLDVVVNNSGQHVVDIALDPTVGEVCDTKSVCSTEV